MEELSYLFLLLGVFSIQGSSENLEENLALKGTAVQSTTYSTCGAANAIDGVRYSPSGKPTPEETYTYCSHTAYDLNPWWRLDLLDSYYIYKVTITNRNDCCPERATGVEIRIGNSLENNGNNNPRCGVTSLVPAGNSVSFSCGGMEGRYVNMYLPKMQEYLVLCEVEVYGTGALLKYFGASSATGQDEPTTSSATHMSPQISDIEDEDLFASTSTHHELSVSRKKQVTRVQVKAAENVDEAELKELVLNKLNQTLSDQDVILTWRTQPNGKVFQKNRTVPKQSPVCSSLK